MITLREMKPEEFSDYCEYFIVDYADEIAANYGHTLTRSRQIAARELAEDLPQGVSTQGHFLFCIEAKEIGTIGYLWYKLLDVEDTAFILDFMIFERFRGQGKGKASLIALEEHLVPKGVKQIKLRVAFKNDRAKYLYEKVGFNITGFNMSKVLNSDLSDI